MDVNNDGYSDATVTTRYDENGNVVSEPEIRYEESIEKVKRRNAEGKDYTHELHNRSMQAHVGGNYQYCLGNEF